MLGRQIEMKAKISYKPQYLTQDYKGDTRSLMQAAYGTDIEGSSVEDQIINPMAMRRLYDKQVNTLSRRRTSESCNLLHASSSADIYAFDEPSAFLDVEDRITFAKFLHRFIKAEGKSALIIDHDMQLIDLVADSLVTIYRNARRRGLRSGFN